MLKIGEFSKLSHITVKALRFYEKEGILMPDSVDEQSGYRFYKTEQLQSAAAVKTYRQLGLSIEEIKLIKKGANAAQILEKKYRELSEERNSIDIRLSVIKNMLGEKKTKYQICEKIIPEYTVYYSETVLKRYSDMMEWIPSVGEECAALNPTLKCVVPNYEFCEYPDGEHKETDIRIRHVEAVKSMGKENESIKFKILPETKVLSIYHKGAYENIGEAYAFIFGYAEANGYKIAGNVRECYIDGIWNKESPDEWLTEIQLPIE